MKRNFQKPLNCRAKFIAFLISLALAFGTLATTLASYRGTYTSNSSAADFSANSLISATTAAAQRLANSDPDGAAVLARQALRISPISAPALRTLGLAEQERGNNVAASKIFSQASGLGWRDIPSQIWLVQAYIAAREWHQAAQHLDAALRVFPYSPSLYGLADDAIQNGALIPELAKRMALNPEWSSPYLGSISSTSLTSHVLLARELTRLHNPPGRKEMLLISNALIGAGRTVEARNLWFLTQGKSPTILYDPKFQYANQTGTAPFEWTLFSRLGADVDVGSEGGLLVVTDNQASGLLAKQMITLQMGVHQIAFQGKMDTSDRKPLYWQIRCMPTGSVIIDGINVPNLRYSFRVPTMGCSYQSVELFVRGVLGVRNSNERVDQLTIW